MLLPRLHSTNPDDLPLINPYCLRRSFGGRWYQTMTQPKLYAILFMLISISACKKSDSNKPVTLIGPDAYICIKKSAPDAEPGETVKLNSCSSPKLSRFFWTFGDGPDQVSGTTVSHAWPRKGTYSIRLNGRDAQGNQVMDGYETMVIGERFLSRIEIKHIAFQDSMGLNWHSNGTGPDLYVSIEPEDRVHDTAHYETPVVPKLRPSDLPLMFDASSRSKLGKKIWYFRIMDYNYPNTPQLMRQYRVDMSTINDNPHTLEAGLGSDWDVRFWYELR